MPTGTSRVLTPNTDLFATRPKLDANGQPSARTPSGNPVLIPELDDPDFFRYVNQPGAATDVKKKDQNHAEYVPRQTADVTSETHAAHNNAGRQVAEYRQACHSRSER